MTIQLANKAERYIPDNLSPAREAICREAVKYIGMKETPFGRNRGPIEEFFPPWQRRALQKRDRLAGYIVKGPPWCAFFVTHVWMKALRTRDKSPVGHIGSVHRMAQRAEDKGLWMPTVHDSAVVFGPAPGDAFVMLDDPLGYGSQGHTGLIIRVSADGKEFLTIEGNTGHAVRVGHRRYDEDEQRGVISVMGDMGHGLWEFGLGGAEHEDVERLGTR